MRERQRVALRQWEAALGDAVGGSAGRQHVRVRTAPESRSQSDGAAPPAAETQSPVLQYFWPLIGPGEITAARFPRIDPGRVVRQHRDEEKKRSVFLSPRRSVISHWKCPKTRRVMSRSYLRRTGWWNVSVRFHGEGDAHLGRNQCRGRSGGTAGLLAVDAGVSRGCDSSAQLGSGG